MKENEAPEKIYLFESLVNGTLVLEWMPKRLTKNDIEYTRTDSFIKKAARYLNYKLYDRVEVVTFGTAIESITSKEEFIEDFKNYMKGE